MPKSPLSQRVILSPDARRDIRAARDWSKKTFGERASRRYKVLLEQAIRDIESDPERLGAHANPNLTLGVRTYHISLSRDRARTDLGVVHNARHIIVYRRRSQSIIDVLRILHDSTDLVRHLPDDHPRSSSDEGPD